MVPSRLLQPDEQAAFTKVFSTYGRVHIPAALPKSMCQALTRQAEDLPYALSVNSGAKSFDLSLTELQALLPEQRAGLEAAIFEGARTGFQYAFESYRLSDEIEAGRSPGGSLAQVFDWLNAPPILAEFAKLGGVAERYGPEDLFVDAQVTRFQPGHVLTTHTDDVAGKNRLMAYVLNLSVTWRADWGGILLFFDQDGHVAEGYVPRFGALNLFRVPQPHAVSAVAPFAGGARLSVTGWIRHR